MELFKKKEYKCQECNINMEIAEIKCHCPQCYKECSWQHLVSCIDCYKLTRQMKTGYAWFCDKHKPTIFLEENSPYFDEAIREGDVVKNNKKYDRKL